MRSHDIPPTRSVSSMLRKSVKAPAIVALLSSMLLGIGMPAQAAFPLDSAPGVRLKAASAELHNRRPFDINPKDVQVLFVDLQPGLIEYSKSIPPASLAANAAVLAKVARLLDIPVTFATVPLQGQPGRHIPELMSYASPKNTVERVMAGTFMERRVVSALAAHRRKVLVVGGYATEVAVLQTALGALKAGYTVYIAVDAIGSRSSRTEAAVLRQMEAAGAIPTSVLALAAQFAPDFSQKPGSDVLKTFDELSPPN